MIGFENYRFFVVTGSEPDLKKLLGFPHLHMHPSVNHPIDFKLSDFIRRSLQTVRLKVT
jgi:hypothetical protein